MILILMNLLNKTIWMLNLRIWNLFLSCHHFRLPFINYELYLWKKKPFHQSQRTKDLLSNFRQSHSSRDPSWLPFCTSHAVCGLFLYNYCILVKIQQVIGFAWFSGNPWYQTGLILVRNWYILSLFLSTSFQVSSFVKLSLFHLVELLLTPNHDSTNLLR